ncbi:MAG: hypothetical protein JW883_17020 [Deltaproteobacteria bacterium]|nr:hypothetical protein [Deltaproteobacteria bacterium]
MPPINTQLMGIIAKMTFIANMKQLPIDWKQPGDQYKNAFKPEELVNPPSLPLPPHLFREASLNKYHVDTAKTIGEQFASFIDKICPAIGFSIDMWRMQAKFKNIMINAVTALGTPGCLDGPKIGSNIKNAPMMVGATDQEKKYCAAVADALEDKWKKWQDNVMVPGLPWYPAFAAFPGPQAPPMPNVPTPLIACPSPMMSELTPFPLKQAMCDALGEKDALHHEELFDAIATGFSMAFLVWLPMQQVMLVLGKGPVPTFAPPYVPVGPVIMGDIISVPGHLMM